MELVTKRDMDDARALGERSGLNMSDDWDEFIHDVAQSIADGRRADPVAWDAMNNRHHEPVEILAKGIYDAFAESAQHPWMPHGNSIMQDEARLRAREVLRANGHTG